MSDAIESLRQAVELSPENVPLRRHLAELLTQAGRHAEAEAELRAALSHAPSDVAIMLPLARAFHSQGKRSEAAILLEQAAKASRTAEQSRTLATLLADVGETDAALAVYRELVDADPDAADDELAARVGHETFEEERPERVAVSRFDDAEPDDFDAVEMTRPEISFGDVGGMDGLKEQVRMKVIYPIANAELFAQYGKAVGGGILMYGPPGCGKTHLARATAGEIDAGFLSVGIEDVLDMWQGNSEQKLHQLFDQARRNAPCVLFFDEVDALGARRSDLKNSAGRTLVNQFLTELDGVTSSNDGVLILAATNSPWTLDVAFRRPGRFDEILFVPPPDRAARIEILRVMLAGKPVDDVDLAAVAAKTVEFTGADLKTVIDRTIEQKLEAAMKTGRPEPIRTADLTKAAKKHKPTCREWLATARNHALYSNESGQYDDVLEYLKAKKD